MERKRSKLDVMQSSAPVASGKPTGRKRRAGGKGFPIYEEKRGELERILAKRSEEQRRRRGRGGRLLVFMDGRRRRRRWWWPGCRGGDS